MKAKPIILAVVALALIVGGVAAATTFGGSIINIGNMWVQGGMEIRPEATPETGSLIDALDEAGFAIDESGNVYMPNMLTFGGPEPAAPIAYTDGDVTWAYGTAYVKAGGIWIDSHPIESPTGAACAIISPYDEPPLGEENRALTLATTSISIPSYYSTYTLWEPGFCELTQTGGNAVSCTIEKSGATIYLQALQSNGSPATSVTGARATWQANITMLDHHQYTCGIVRNPSVDTASLLAWKQASVEASRLPDDQFFVFIKDENGDWYHSEWFEPGIPIDAYRGLEVAWFIWKVAE